MKPPLACKNCRARKKKCDRGYPVCSYCLKTRDRCEYRVTGSPKQNSSRAVSLTPVVRENHAPQTIHTAALFLGYPSPISVSSKAFSGDINIGPELANLVSESKETGLLIADFLETVDTWMPYIPRQDLWRLASNPSLKGEDILLLACIQLMMEPLHEGEAAHKKYLAVKAAFMNVEIGGALTIRSLQALVLVLFYEYGNALFPSAYMTIGACIRYARALGLETSSDESRSWIENELRRRLWWAIYVMERIMALGCPNLPLSLKEPDEGQFLPSDDASWQHETPPSHPNLTLLSPARSNMGTFRLLVHAAYLVGRVIHIISDHHAGRSIIAERRVQLHRTIGALMNVLEVELQMSLVSVNVARSILNSAMYVLFSVDEDDDPEFGPVLGHTHPLGISAQTCLERAAVFVEGGPGNVHTVHPFLINWGFHTYRYFYARYRQDGRQETVDIINVLSQAMEILGERWKLSGMYMSLLNADQII